MQVQVFTTAVPQLTSDPIPPGISAQVLPVDRILTNDTPVRSLDSEQGQAVAEYAAILAAIIGLLAFVTGFGLVTARVLNWISNNITF